MPNTIDGSAANDSLAGTSAADLLNGYDGDDTLDGGAGNDSLDGGAGNDSLDGGAGADSLDGGFGDDTLSGGADGDTLVDERGSNVLYGGDGNDAATSRSVLGSHVLRGELGSDTLAGAGVRVDADGGDGDDVISATAEIALGSVVSYAQDAEASLTGGAGEDRLEVYQLTASTLDGGAGNDQLNAYAYGRAGYIGGDYMDLGTRPVSTVLRGGEGADSLYAWVFASAELDGGDGDDYFLCYGAGAATLAGGAGADSLQVAIWGGSGISTHGDQQHNKTYALDGGDDDDILHVSGDNAVENGATRVSALGGAGGDAITVFDNGAGTGADGHWYGIAYASVDGGDGADTITAYGVLQATLAGGSGSDTFVITARQYRTILEGERVFGQTGTDSVTLAADPLRVTDFSAGSGGDVLDIDDLLNDAPQFDGVDPFESGFLVVERTSGGVALRFDADGIEGQDRVPVTVVVLEGVDATALVGANFSTNFLADASTPVPLTLNGTAAGDTLVGGAGRDTLDGGAGPDFLDGAGGGDLLRGGEGNDRYAIRDGLDAVVEAGSGIDTAESWVDAWVLAAELENGLVARAAGASLTGNALSNRLTGGAGDDTLDGAAGDDRLSGGAGLDTASFASASGGVSVSLALAGVAQDTGDGVDTLVGIENLLGSAFADLLGGNGAANRLDGGAGADTLRGGAGADTYRVDDAGDLVEEFAGGGVDTVFASVARTLGANQENLVLVGAGAIAGVGNVQANRLTGNEAANRLAGAGGADTLKGGAGNDTLDGGAGADSMVGGTGDDTYVVDEAGDLVVESSLAACGVDTVLAGVGYALKTGVEHLRLLDTAAWGKGNALDNRVTGNGEANRLDGLAGADTLAGGAGADTLSGGMGVDSLAGGAGADVFEFTRANQSGNNAANADTVSDFLSGNDRIDLSGIDARASTTAVDDAFTFIGSAAFSALDATGQLRYEYAAATGAGILYGSTDADADAEFAIRLTGVVTLLEADLIL